MKRVFYAGAVCAAVLAFSSPVFAFGTVRALGQNAEHERITRHALGCGLFDDEDCFEKKTLRELAGDKDNFGAIGIPDRGELITVNKAHCDSGDYFDIPGYPQTKEQARLALERCRAGMQDHMREAVADAADLVSASGSLRGSQLAIPCVFIGQVKGHAKCNVLQDLGLLLHASQDFYAHTNWVDVSDSTQPISVENPPGLNQRGRAPWLDLRNPDPAFPEGLISGCFQNLPEEKHCNYGPNDSLHRVKHMVVNKDDGAIDPVLGAGTTIRGSHDDNFAHAVEAAIDDTRDKWADFRERLAATYGPQEGELMACAISHDDPVQNCR
ncbi:MAG TPA: hypothetical protein VG867_00290 [Rhizomicrobium sp.]|nr:hypothetical protein [Rhizomicrobium sp.]